METTKTCNKCSLEKSLDMFYEKKTKKGTISYTGECKDCTRERTKQWRKDNPERKKALDDKWRKENPDRKAAADKAWREANPERKKENDRKYREEKKEEIREYKRTNVQYKIRDKWSKRLWALIRKGHWSSETSDIIGMGKEQMLKWIEYQFDSNMTFENYGEYWQIDHVTPCYMFDLEDDEELRKCFSWKNTRPLPKNKNLSKGKKMIPFEVVIQELKVYHY